MKPLLMICVFVFIALGNPMTSYSQKLGVMDAVVVEFSAGGSGATLIMKSKGIKYNWCIGNSSPYCSNPKTIGDVWEAGNKVRLWYKSKHLVSKNNYMLVLSKIQEIKQDGNLDDTKNNKNKGLFADFIDPYLNRNYPDWKVTSDAPDCVKEFQKSFVKGDFNGDGEEDYVLKFRQSRKGFIIAFVRSGSSYKAHILESGTSEFIKNQGLTLARKGETYSEIINDNFDRVNRRLQNDAPVGGSCESSTYFYIYRNGSFRRAFTSD